MGFVFLHVGKCRTSQEEFIRIGEKFLKISWDWKNFRRERGRGLAVEMSVWCMQASKQTIYPPTGMGMNDARRQVWLVQFVDRLGPPNHI